MLGNEDDFTYIVQDEFKIMKEREIWPTKYEEKNYNSVCHSGLYAGFWEQMAPDGSS